MSLQRQGHVREDRAQADNSLHLTFKQGLLSLVLTVELNHREMVLEGRSGYSGWGRIEEGFQAPCLPKSRKQPHSVIQRRLLEGNLNRLRGESREHTTWVQSPLATDKAENKAEDRRKEPTVLLVHCKCEGQVLRAAVNTGCQQNLISRSCLRQLGLEEVSNIGCRDFSLPVPCVVSRVEHMEVQFGQEMVACSALVVDDEMLEFSLGLQTLLSLKCCIDLDEGVLRLKALSQELPFLPASEEPGQ
ncbi:PREDICTED: nuclear receptor-interacting protein 2 isoform X2 [Gavialis gangeticus]|uniref:nuclear receptor-interacting protein 2 isoform X2 n=1 Tax=Gavialis gangeticus TaxID=94835 RepID=UPI00092F68A8|nr:PREDICTED: nuclear receptor-interacting protein 2 isoform X2 [Gavialis gangeticus]